MVTVGPGGASPVAFLKGAPEMVASFCLRESGEDLTLKTCPGSYITLRRTSRSIWNTAYLFLHSVLFCLCALLVTVPSHFSPILREYAGQGFRVLGFAYKHLTKETDLSTVERSAVLFYKQ